MSTTESSGTPPRPPGHPPPERVGERQGEARTETRTCGRCAGEGYATLDIDYAYDTGLLTIVGGLCVTCRGTGEVVVYIYGAGR